MSSTINSSSLEVGAFYAWLAQPFQKVSEPFSSLFVLRPKPTATLKTVAYLERGQKGKYLTRLRHLKLEFQITSLFLSNLLHSLNFTKNFFL